MKNKKAESLVWIIVWVFILSFVLLWIWNLIWNSRENISKFNEQMEIDILTKNSSKIIDNLDLSVLYDWEIFYIYKNKSSKQYQIFTWSTNEYYKYINSYWEKIDIVNYKWKIYTRSFITKKININWELKTVVKPLIEKLNK